MTFKINMAHYLEKDSEGCLWKWVVGGPAAWELQSSKEEEDLKLDEKLWHQTWRVKVWATCVFRVFLGSSGQPSVVFWIHWTFSLMKLPISKCKIHHHAQIIPWYISWNKLTCYSRTNSILHWHYINEAQLSLRQKGRLKKFIIPVDQMTQYYLIGRCEVVFIFLKS